MQDSLEVTTIRKIYWRLVPMLFLAMLLNYLDRFNVGFAALRMNQDMGFNPTVFGAGASLVYAGYMLFGIPSNFLLYRLGAQKWLGCIAIAWGSVAVLMAFIWNAHSFFGLRFLLGTAEAGFQPGVALYVTFWFPSAYRARAIGGYIVGSHIAFVVGAPISSVIMTTLDGALGLHSWQWMFIVEGLPAILLGCGFLILLTDRPQNALWLSEEQRTWLQERLAAEQAEQEQGRQYKLTDILIDRRVWSLAALFGFALVGVNALNIWMPQIIRELGHGHLSLIQIGFLSAAPSLLGIIGVILISFSSDRTGDRKFHLAGLYFVAACALVASAYVRNPVAAYLLLCLVGLSINAGSSLFWSLNSSLMSGVAAAGSIAFVNTIAQFGGLIGPWVSGYIRSSTGSFTFALVGMAGFLVLSALIALTLRIAPVGRDSAPLKPSLTSVT